MNINSWNMVAATAVNDENNFITCSLAVSKMKRKEKKTKRGRGFLASINGGWNRDPCQLNYTFTSLFVEIASMCYQNITQST